MVRWLSRMMWRQPVANASRLLLQYRRLRARYDAAVTNSDNQRHWTNADGLSANAANSTEVRRILRNRARYEVANNSYARGIVLTLAHDVIGTGPRLQMLTPDVAVNRFVEQEFSGWSHAVRLPEKLRTMRIARQTVPELHELGGFATVGANRKRRRRARYPPRPFMGPAMEREMPNFEGLWAKSVR